MEGVSECWTHSCVCVLLTATAIKACVVYVYGDHQLTSLQAVWAYRFAALRCEGTRRRVVVERLEA